MNEKFFWVLFPPYKWRNVLASRSLNELIQSACRPAWIVIKGKNFDYRKFFVGRNRKLRDENRMNVKARLDCPTTCESLTKIFATQFTYKLHYDSIQKPCVSPRAKRVGFNLTKLHKRISSSPAIAERFRRLELISNCADSSTTFRVDMILTGRLRLCNETNVVSQEVTLGGRVESHAKLIYHSLLHT